MSWAGPGRPVDGQAGAVGVSDMAGSVVLVVTAPVDPTADLVVGALRERGARVARLDTAAFPAHATLTARIPAGASGWVGSWCDEVGEVVLDDVAAVYYRRPGRFTVDAAVAAEHREWCEGQARYGVWGVLESLHASWVNHPRAVAGAEYKPRQLALAAELGLAVPDTLITNDPDAAAGFVAELPGGVVTKALYARGPRDDDGAPALVLYTSLVPPQRAGEDCIALSAHLFQQFIPKRCDVRVTVVDDRLFAAAIHDADPANREDWRRSHHGLRYETCEVPDPIAHKARALVRGFGLRFAALDFLITPDGDWIFLELNGNGQWAWVQLETGLPIAEGLADALLTPPPNESVSTGSSSGCEPAAVGRPRIGRSPP